MAAQLPLPLTVRSALGREDFIVAAPNEAAVGFVDSWPGWSADLAALHGPSGSGKSHLVAVWQERSAAQVIACSDLDEDAIAALSPLAPVAIEDVDQTPPSLERDTALFSLIERAQLGVRIILTGREPPQAWATALPDLASRFQAMLAFPLWAPDDTLLTALARKLFTDRQLEVADPVIMRMISSLERSPAAIRDFVARADAKALASHRPVTLALVRELLEEDDGSVS
ncbi:MAG TPA: hypothetical protein VH000_10100 [Rhizomicrobium sp.]|nr:hypothetical protein [Rhizomicrobium sp.]